MTLATATRLGPYEILGPLGAGGMGEVYRARDTRLGREVAIKVLPETVARDPERLARFEREARTVAALSHENLLAIHDFGATPEGAPYAVTELLEGETLRARLREGTPAARRAIEIGVQIARGLAAAHDKGIVHRDLKPENVWLCADGRVKILDFGLARAATAAAPSDSSVAPTATVATAAGLVVGTVGYMSPEQVRGTSVDARSDLFSFGAVLYEMLSGRRAFAGDTPADTMSAILREEPPELSRGGTDLPAGIERIVARCLEKQPAARFQSAHDLAFALEALVGSSSGSGLRPALAEPVPARGSRLVPVLGIGTLTLVAGLGAGLLTGRASAPRRMPTFQAITFQRGSVQSARFGPDGRTILFGAAFEGRPVTVYSTMTGAGDSRPLDLPSADVVGVARTGDMAVLLGRHHAGSWERVGTLAQVPVEGGSPRPILEQAFDADIAPGGDRFAVVRADGPGRRLEYPIDHVIFRTPGWIGCPRIAADGRRIAFIVHPYVDDDIGYVALAGGDGRVERLTPDYEFAQGLAWSPKQDELWTSAVGAQGYEIWAVARGRPKRLLFRGPAAVRIQDVAPDGRALVTQDAMRADIIGRLPGDDHERIYSWWSDDSFGGLTADGTMFVASASSHTGAEGYFTYVRRNDGRPPVRLGAGAGIAITPDGSYALQANLEHGLDTLRLVPTGAGTTRTIALGGIRIYQTGNRPLAGVSADRRRLAFVGMAGRQGPRGYVLDLDGGKPQGVTSEGVESLLLSRDGTRLAAVFADGRIEVQSVHGGTPVRVIGARPDETPVGWDAAGRGLLLWDRTFPIRVDRVDVASGARSVFREIAPDDPAGILYGALLLAPDGDSYLYRVRRSVSQVLVVAGLR